VNAAITNQLTQVACGYRYLFSSEPPEELTHLLLTKCGADFEPIVYSSSGSEAVKSAMKVALICLRSLDAVRRASLQRRVLHRTLAKAWARFGRSNISGAIRSEARMGQAAEVD
jgi:4-aminobutyrate aminotransferase-like enzyme